MADITIPVIGGASKRLKDMGDGTHAEVVATALSLDGVQIEGGGLTPAESAALQAVATESAQIQQIVHEAAIRIAVEAVAAVIAGGRLKVDGAGVTQPVSAAALPLPAGAATAVKQDAQITAEQASANVLGTTADAAAASGTLAAMTRWIAGGIGTLGEAPAASGSLLGMLRALVARLPSAIGPQNAANSLAVTLASDGTFATAIGTTASAAPASGATSGTLIGWMRALVEEVRARLPAARRVGEPQTVSVASAAASAVVYCPGAGWLDLGAEWSPAMLVAACRANGVGSANERMALECCDDTSGTTVLLGISTSGVLASNNQVLSASGSDVGTTFRPMARYCRLKWTNGSTAQNSTAILRLIGGLPA